MLFPFSSLKAVLSVDTLFSQDLVYFIEAVSNVFNVLSNGFVYLFSKALLLLAREVTFHLPCNARTSLL